MTVQAQSSTQYYDGPIVVGTILPIVDFIFIDNSHVSAKIRGEEYIWKYGEDYLISGAGELVRTIEVLREVTEGQTLAVYLDVPITQNIAPEEGGNFPASTNEFVLDKLTYICQMLYERVVRSMQVSIDTSFDGTLPKLLPNKAIKINNAGTGLELSDLDPDAAVKEIQVYIQQAKEFADQATAAAVNAQATVSSLNVTAEQIYAAADVAEKKADDAVARVEAAEEHKLNSKEIATILESSIPQTNSDLQLANGRIITSEDKNYNQLHNIYMTKKRKLTDVHTKYYKYNSYNYSRIWYSTVQSVPDKYYGLSDVINAEAGTWYLFDRQGKPVARPSVSVKSYYKYELINAVGDTTPNQNILWPVLMGDLQTAEPSTEDKDDFWAYKDDERLGAHIDNITNIVVLPPDVTSEYRRIQITRVVNDNTYYYYYKATPIEIHAYMFGNVAELNLSGVAGVQTADTVIHPYLITTNDGYLDKITNDEFMSTREWVEAAMKSDDYTKFYSAVDGDQTYEIENLHDEVDVIGQLTNRAGVFSGFTFTDKLELLHTTPKSTQNFDGTFSQKINSLEICLALTTGAVNTDIRQVLMGQVATNFTSPQISKLISTSATGGNCFEAVIGKDATSWNTQLYSLEPITANTSYKVKIVWNNETKLGELYLAIGDQEFVKQSEAEWPTIYWINNIQLGADIAADQWFGSIDLTNSYVKVNDEMLWGSKVVPYAKDSEGNFISQYAYNKEVDYQGQLASNVYETLPEGYTLVGNAESVDGWFAPIAKSQGHFLGTGLNNKFIDYKADNYIDIRGRFMTGRNGTTERILVALLKSQYTFCPFRMFCSANSKVVKFALGAASTQAWGASDITSEMTIEYNSEYYFEFKADFTKKYKLVDSEYVEAEDGTLYKYEALLRKWIGPEDNDIAQTFTFYNAYRFGSAALDLYQISGASNCNYYTLNETTYINMFSISVNDRMLFNDNMHVIARPAGMTALPRIADKNGIHSYVVCANGITEDVILATPQQQIDAYTQDTILPQIEAAKNTANSLVNQSAQSAISQIDGAYAGQLSNMTANYNQSMENITQNYNTSMAGITNNYNQSMETITNTQVVLIDSYVNGASWYRVYSDGWCEQGGYGVLSDRYEITLFKAYRDTNYHVQGEIVGTDATGNMGTQNKYVDKIVGNLSGSTSHTVEWIAYGYIDITE